MENSELKNEQARVDEVTAKISRKILATQEEFNKAHQEITKVQKDYSNNTSVNYFEVDDRMETSAELQQQRNLVTRLSENENIIKRQLGTYNTLKPSPYFGRIDIQDEGELDEEQLYIGTASFVDDSGEFLIYDWRAPISSIYYNGVLGKASYQTPNGAQKTELKKKRQFKIIDGQIKNMFDTNETIGDEMLQDALSNQNDEYMQNIVATIQSEQNDIIRDTYHDLLVVQGVAGSGKTSAILQRIAFLLYHSRDTLEADQIILFSPNKLFSHYISEVLPSLGERNMRQVTFNEFMANRLQGVHVQSLFDRYENDRQNNDFNPNIRDLKESGQFIDNLITYCNQLEASELAFVDIYFNGRVFFSKEEIRTTFEKQPRNLKIYDRFLQTKNALIKILKHRIELETKADWVNEEIDQLSEERYHDLVMDKELGEFQDEEVERHYIAKILVTERLRQVYDAIFNGNFFDPYIQYNHFLNHYPLPAAIDPKQWQLTIEHFNQQVEFHQMDLEDVAPFMYLRDYCLDDGKNVSMKYLFIDEMQDYSIAQLKYLKYAFPETKWTLLGDSEQALFKAVEAPESLLTRLDQAIDSKHSKLIKLLKSYRSTYQITTFVKSILPKNNEIEAFNRQGVQPELLITSNLDQGFKSLLETIDKQADHNENIAILTKNMTEAELIYNRIHRQTQATLLKDADRTLPKGVVILPIYLAKGLEFDSVIAWDVSKQNYPTDDLLGTLYTIMTRAMHQLTMISINEVSPLITRHSETLNNLIITRKIN